ncbi:hypothetical protein AZE42_08887, partial [Rhizopogon vesiculosus]
MEVNIKDTFGATFIGGMVAAIVYGVTTLQVSSFSDDPDHALIIAFWSLIVSDQHWLTQEAAMYGHHRANILYFSDIPSDPFEYSMVADMRYYGGCFRTLCRKFSIWIRFEKKEFAAIQRITFTRYIAAPFAITTILSDICITVALCVLLHGNRSPIIETNVLVNTLIVYAINRCLLTSIMSVAEIIVSTTSPNSLWFMAIDFVIGKLYTNSFLASLNSRNSLRERSLHSRNESTSFRLNAAVNLSGLGSSTEGDSSASAQNQKSNVSGSAHVKTILDDLE